MALSDNYSVPTRERLAMLINEHNGTNLKYQDDFLVGMPASYGHGLRYNTSLVLYWQRGPGVGQAQRIFYRRLSLDKITRGATPVFKICKTGFYINDILPLINAHFGTGFEPGDLVNDFISQDVTLYECRAADTSLAWNGGKLDIRFEYLIKEIQNEIDVLELDGLYPPTVLPVAGKTKAVVAKRTAAKPVAVKPAVVKVNAGVDSIW